MRLVLQAELGELLNATIRNKNRENLIIEPNKNERTHTHTDRTVAVGHKSGDRNIKMVIEMIAHCFAPAVACVI